MSKNSELKQMPQRWRQEARELREHYGPVPSPSYGAGRDFSAARTLERLADELDKVLKGDPQ